VVDLPRKQRPVIVLLGHAIRWAIAAGLREFDFLAGVAQYKMDLTDSAWPLVQVRAVRPSVLETLRAWADRGLGWARQCKRALRSRRKSPAAGASD
jgi:hypothetical protein